MTCLLEVTQAACGFAGMESRDPVAVCLSAFDAAHAELTELLCSECAPERLEAAAVAGFAAAVGAGMPGDTLHWLRRVQMLAAKKQATARSEQRLADLQSQLGRVQEITRAENRYFRHALNRIYRADRTRPQAPFSSCRRGQRARRPAHRRTQQRFNRSAGADSGGDGDGDGDGPPRLAGPKRPNEPASKRSNRASTYFTFTIERHAAIPTHSEAEHG
ncbi:MAG TPA: hypothetical protein VJV79_00015 [Polyangiaceae bacterium]|nr:hypothetical protein [Polyangiaceae bacterium]